MTWLRVALVTLLFALNTVPHVAAVLVLALIKALFPATWVRRRCNRLLMAIAESWIDINNGMIRAFTPTRIYVQFATQPDPAGHYLIIANHQSWVDIPVLQAVVNRRVPFARFFLKSQLIWVPLLGLAWWALDFPFMKRYSKAALARRPQLAGRDMAATRRACEKFRGLPVSIVNYVEGTRFSAAKRVAQESPYRALLRPRAGGMTFVLDAMGDALHSILDMTIVYPQGAPTIVDLLAGRVAEVRVHVRELPIPRELLGDYRNDEGVRERMQDWINERWLEKDRLIGQMKGAGTLVSAEQATSG